MTNAAGQLVKKPKKPKAKTGSGRVGKNVPANWEGFDSPVAKPARRSPIKATNRAGGKAPTQSRAR
jgi:hypothetical protein